MAVSGTYGGHSPCVEIETGGPEYVLCDLGRACARSRRRRIARHGAASPQTYHIFMSHVHWDHIMGFPFFTPAYFEGNRLRIYGGHAELEEAFRRQQAHLRSPWIFRRWARTSSSFAWSQDAKYEVAGLQVRLMLQRHSGDSYGYRFTSADRTVIYSTDSEHTLADLCGDRTFRRFLSRCRRGRLRCDVLSDRRDLGQGGLGPFEQYRRRRAVPDGRGTPSVPVPP